MKTYKVVADGWFIASSYLYEFVLAGVPFRLETEALASFTFTVNLDEAEAVRLGGQLVNDNPLAMKLLEESDDPEVQTIQFTVKPANLSEVMDELVKNWVLFSVNFRWGRALVQVQVTESEARRLFNI